MPWTLSPTVMQRVFVYGTLKRGFRLHHNMREARFLGTGFVDGFAMYRVEWYPAIIETQDQPGRIFGEVFEVNDDTLAILDEVEDRGILYERFTRQVQMLSGLEGTVEALLYVYLDSIEGQERIHTGRFDLPD